MSYKKIAILNADKVANMAALVAIDVATISDGAKRYVVDVGRVYTYDAADESGGVPPTIGGGRWKDDKGVAQQSSLLYAVNDNYDFGANSATDVTSVVKLLSLFEQGMLGDYKVFRRALMNFVGVTGFSNLLAQDKITASKNFVVVKTDRDTVHSNSDQIANGVEFHRNSIAARSSRIIAAEAEIYNRLQSSDANEVIADGESPVDLRGRYVQFGRESLAGDGVEGIYDYIQATTGTSFATTGLATKTYTPVFGTIAELVARCMAILDNGDY